MSSPDNELVDVIDEAGLTIGVVSRGTMRAQRLPHRCTYILVFHPDGRLFIHQRTPTKDVFPSYWDVCVGGVLAAGEQFDEGAERELAEELGVTAPLKRLFPFRFADERTSVQAQVFAAVHAGPFRLQPEEVIQGGFVKPVEIEALCQSRPFCPDGLAVWDIYRQLEGSRKGAENAK